MFPENVDGNEVLSTYTANMSILSAPGNADVPLGTVPVSSADASVFSDSVAAT
jgi:hypothetical protein